MQKNKRAFTLIELLVVVLIIGILSAIALPQYQKAVFKSRVAGQLALIDGFLKAQRVYFLENNVYTTRLDNLSVETRVGNSYWTCGQTEEGGIYCDIHPYPNEILYWNVNLLTNGKQEIQCAAKADSNMALSVCQSYAPESTATGGGTWKYITVRTID